MKNWNVLLNQPFPGLTINARKSSNPSTPLSANEVGPVSQKWSPGRQSEYVRRMRALAIEAALVYTMYGAAKYSEYVEALALAMTAPHKFRPEVGAAPNQASAPAKKKHTNPVLLSEKRGEQKGRRRLGKPVWHVEPLTAIECLEVELDTRPPRRRDGLDYGQLRRECLNRRSHHHNSKQGDRVGGHRVKRFVTL